MGLRPYQVAGPDYGHIESHCHIDDDGYHSATPSSVDGDVLEALLNGADEAYSGAGWTETDEDEWMQLLYSLRV